MTKVEPLYDSIFLPNEPKEEPKLPLLPEITLSTFVKNEEHCIEHMFKSVKDYVHEIVVLDTGSTDRTLEICKDYNARIYQVGFSDFGKIRTVASQLARKDWVLMLDADETLEGGQLLQDVIKRYTEDTQNNEREAVAFPRKRWLDLEMTQQTELEAYPDYQVRFYQNLPIVEWHRGLHEVFHGLVVSHEDMGPVIHHFQDVFKDEAANERRRILYEKLAPIAKVELHGGKSLEEE